MSNTSIRKYIVSDSCIIYKTKDAFGGLSNMASGFPIIINEINYKTSEALYQACKFSKYPEVQNEIINARSPMTAKMNAKKHSEYIRDDWDSIKVQIMRWCLSLKLSFNYTKFASLLLSTGNKPIVEHSKKDIYWGAKIENDKIVGINALGRLLMELREKVIANDLYDSLIVQPPSIHELYLFNKPISPIDNRIKYFNEIKEKLKMET